ncbi:MAG: lytic transglycosylase domain-containing protein [Selenomonadaceae bacterium]|nr:lytic transglycosylase domain-containing protein [Selenomonadaceae bacterium]
METSNNGQSQDSANISRGSIYQRPARTVQNPALNSLPGEEALPSSINNSINPSAAIASNPTVNLEGENVETPTRTTNRESILSTEEMLEAAAAKYNVDPKLVRAVAIAESDLNQSAISSKGAIGVMQLMPETARSLGVDPYDVQQNIDGGTRYLKQLLDSFNGDVQKAIAAYNAGSGAVRRYGGIPPYAETQRYVGRVMNLLNGREQPRF